MKLKLKDNAPSLESHSSHHGFPKSVWAKLNAGEVVEFNKIPDDAKDQVEEVEASTGTNNGGGQ